MWSPPGDNAADTFQAIIAALPHAPLSDLQAMQGVGSRFSARAHAAEAAGRHAEAEHFATWAQAFAPPAPVGSPAATGSSPVPSQPVAGATPEKQSQPPPTAAASPVRPTEPAPSQAAARSGEPSLPPDTVALLLRRGAAMQQLGDISAARLLYDRAAMAGSAQAATAMGKTFDPGVLAEIGARGIAPDPGTAASWYRKAIALGDRDAENRLQDLRREQIATGVRPPSPPSVMPPLRLARAPALPREHHVARAADAQCRAIVVKVQLGEEPSDAERAYLRQGCQHR